VQVRHEVGVGDPVRISAVCRVNKVSEQPDTPIETPFVRRQVFHPTFSQKDHSTNRPSQRYNSAMPMKVRELVRLLEERGWIEIRSRGSHRHFKHPEHPHLITVPGNAGKELAPGTLQSILKKAGLK
jgi:predicted RNA binding protein YcfA (HicA-like mRNA interferase family)